MKRLLASFLLALGLAAQTQPQSPKIFQEIDGIIQELSRITGLAPLRKVQYDTINKAHLNQFLEERIREEVKPEEIRDEEMMLKKFGFVPQDFDLKKTTIDLFTEQAAAFYDFKKKKLFVLDSSSSTLQQAALVHELAHALADQHFHLEKFIDRAGANDDSSLARMAVMEGQATWLMSEYLAQRMGQSLKGSEFLVDMMTRMVGGAKGQFPIFDNAPLYIRESLLFPYTAGMKFQHAVFEKMGKPGFSEVFRRPPATTQQVLHPEKYFEPVAVAPAKLPEVAKGRSYREVADGTLGEFDHAVLLRQYVDEEAARSLAPRWRAGSYKLLEDKKDKHVVLAYVSVWERPEDARKFFELYAKILKGKWKSMEVTEQSDKRLAGRGDDGDFLVGLDGARVWSLEGMRDPAEAKSD
jgi:hypothetical protein